MWRDVCGKGGWESCVRGQCVCVCVCECDLHVVCVCGMCVCVCECACVCFCVCREGVLVLISMYSAVTLTPVRE